MREASVRAHPAGTDLAASSSTNQGGQDAGRVQPFDLAVGIGTIDLATFTGPRQTTCSDGTGRTLSCDQHTCTCCRDSNVFTTFAQTQPCPTDDGGGPDSRIAKAANDNCFF